MNEIAAEAVRGVLGAHAAVSFAVLFGSLAAARARPDSDADIGVGCGKGKTMPFSERFELALELERVVGREVDLVVLDEASPLLRLEAARGDCLYERERWIFGDFVAAALLEFDDVRPHLLRCGRAPLGNEEALAMTRLELVIAKAARVRARLERIRSVLVPDCERLDNGSRGTEDGHGHGHISAA